MTPMDRAHVLIFSVIVLLLMYFSMKDEARITHLEEMVVKMSMATDLPEETK